MHDQTIVLVCDDRVLGELLSDILADQKYSQLVCTQLAHAYDTIRSRRPQLLVLDIYAPAPAAEWHLLEQLRHDPDMAAIPVIICTTNPATPHLQPPHLPPGCTILEKPFMLEALIALVMEQIGPPQ
jgi:DNA-binding response OmpR family regulator